MKLKAKRLNARQAVLLFTDYFEAMGTDSMMSAFGWSRPKDAVCSAEHNRSERFYEFTDSGVRVGWAKMHLSMVDPDDDEAIVARGIWPEFQNKGYGKAILEWLANKARGLGASYISRSVLATNEQVYERSIAEALRPDTPWIHAGDSWYPPPMASWFIWPLKRDPADQKPERKAQS